jgi:pimeloyl-ACP methyl ester carboxylesterase
MRNIMFVLLVLLSWQCGKETAALQKDANEVFWVRNEGADMPVWVMGNTVSRVFIFFVHGGPGDCAYRYAGFQTEMLRRHYAVAFWSERNAGASAGNNNFNRLSLDQMVDDLEATLKILRHRYGEDISIFLHGHSFGGLLGSAFLCRNNNQDQIKGWIEVDGAHNYPLTNLVSRQMLIDSGLAYIDRGRFVPEWQEIVDYCSSHQANTSLDVSYRINGYAQDAEKYLDTPPWEWMLLPGSAAPGKNW